VAPFIQGLQRAARTTEAPKPRTEANPYAKYRDNPVGFATEVLGLMVWEAMESIFLGVLNHDRVAVRSGHKVSKSTTAAVIALWRCLCRENSRTVLTAPTSRQVKNIIWKELRKLHQAARLPGELFIDPGTGFRYMGSEVFGFSTNEAEKMAGVSGEDLWFILDEASGMAEVIYEAIEGNLAGGGGMLLLSNPTQTSGTFYEAFTSKAHLWHRIHISSETTPNVLQGRSIIPGLATLAWVNAKKADWGEDSPLYQVRVKGNFPDQSENSVIGLALVEMGRERYRGRAHPPMGRFALGVDVARYGDDNTVLQPVFEKGATVLPTVHRKQDNVEVAGHVMDLVERLRRDHGYPVETGPVHVKIDDLGNGGGVTDTLKHSERAAALGIVVCPVIVSNRATATGYSLLRDQLWFALRDWLKESGQLPPDALLEGELVAPLYSFDSQGRAKVESKDDLKKRLGRSPDRADALCLGIYEPPTSQSNSDAIAALRDLDLFL
jgi:phage terminase large subunit